MKSTGGFLHQAISLLCPLLLAGGPLAYPQRCVWVCGHCIVLAHITPRRGRQRMVLDAAAPERTITSLSGSAVLAGDADPSQHT